MKTNKLGLIMAAMMIAGYSQVGLGQNLNEGLVAYYPFNGNANDESGNGNHGSVSGARLTADRNDVDSNAYKFDGDNDFITLSNPNAFKLKKHTISIWVKFLTLGNTISILTNEPGIPGEGWKSDGFGLGAREDGKLFYRINTGSTQADWGGIYIHTKTASNTIKPSTWYQIVTSYDGNVQKIYLNGELIKTVVAGITISFSNTPVIIGDTYCCLSYIVDFEGDLDDLRFYNRALSEAEVAALYELEKQEEKPPLILAQPKSSTHPEGSNFNVTVGINGIYTDVFIQWFKDGQFLSGQNYAELAINNASLEDSGEYYALISAGGETLMSDVAEITIVEIDTDNDGLNDSDEINIHKTDPNLADTDEDGLSDGEEVNIHNTNPNDPDTDRDSLDDFIEINLFETSPLNVDTNGNGIPDGDEDFDSDGLSNGDELNKYKTNPILVDTDGDGLPDGVEIAEGFDPLVGTEAADGALAIHTAIELEFFTLKSQQYVIQSSTDLENWEDVTGKFQGKGGFYSIFASTREKQYSFWRLKVVE